MVRLASDRNSARKDTPIAPKYRMSPTDYKNTEIGFIPNDWEACDLPRVIWFQEGPGLRKWQFRSNGLKVINVTNLQENGYLDLTKTERHISWEEFDRTYKHFLIDAGDVVVASSGNSYCKTAIVRDRDLPLLMNTSVIRFKAKEGMDPSYMLAYLKSAYFKAQIDLMITGGAQPNFGPVHLRKAYIPLPPKKSEQAAIARALLEMDEAIELLEQLALKKCQVKQGAIQELLSGNSRLPGFTENWKHKTVAEIFEYLPTATNSRADLSEDGDAYYVHYGDIHTKFHGHLDFRLKKLPRINRDKCKNASFVRNGDWIIVDASEDFDGIAKAVEVCGLQDGIGVVSGLHTFLLRERKPTYAPGFKGYLRDIKSVRDQLIRLATGMKVFGVSKTVLRNVVLPMPSWDEQAAIVTCLSEMDSEIAEVEAKLAKARQLKQGTMQALLTGRVRLT